MRFSKVTSLIVGSLTLVSLSVGSAAAAGNATLAAASDTTSYNPGATFTTSIVLNTAGEQVNVVELMLSYNSAVLQLDGISCAGAFEIATPAGANKQTCGTTSAKSGVVTAAFAQFHTVAVGSSDISIASGTHVFNSASVDVWNGAANGTNYSVVEPAPAPSPTPAAPRVLAASTENNDAAPADETAPVVTPEVKVTTPAPQTKTDVVLPAAQKKGTAWPLSVGILAVLIAAVYVAAEREKVRGWFAAATKKAEAEKAAASKPAKKTASKSVKAAAVTKPKATVKPAVKAAAAKVSTKSVVAAKPAKKRK